MGSARSRGAVGQVETWQLLAALARTCYDMVLALALTLANGVPEISRVHHI